MASERVRFETLLEHQALHDGLTDLPNRLMFRQQIEKALAERTSVAVLVLDLDNFREINDTFGHKIGDGLLGQIGPRLRQQLDDGDLIARLGGDEFGILIRDADAAHAMKVADAILRVERPFLIEGHPLEVTASIGITAFPQHGSTAETLLQRADVALYVAKRSGNSAATYRPEDDPYDPSRVVLQADLRQAIARREIILYYQPQVAIATGAVTGFEALARWRHAQRGWIPPGEFIPVAERMGLIKALTAYLVELAARQLVDWQRSGISIPVAVNVSMRNLLDPRFPATMKDIAATTGIEGRRIKLEITESALMTEPARALETMNELRANGFGFSIDDFGTGYSSLAYLQRLPTDHLLASCRTTREARPSSAPPSSWRAASAWTWLPRVWRMRPPGRICGGLVVRPPRAISSAARCRRARSKAGCRNGRNARPGPWRLSCRPRCAAPACPRAALRRRLR